jgi:hypothetical protein
MDLKELANPDLFQPHLSSKSIGINYGNVSNSVYDNMQNTDNLQILYGGKKNESIFCKNNMLNILLFIILISSICGFLGYKYYKKRQIVKKREKKFREYVSKNPNNKISKKKRKNKIVKNIRNKINNNMNNIKLTKQIRSLFKKKISNKRNLRIDNNFLL